MIDIVIALVRHEEKSDGAHGAHKEIAHYGVVVMADGALYLAAVANKVIAC